MSAYARFIDALGDRVERQTSDSATARCPAHDDNTPSLSVSQSGDKVVFHCHYGCTPADIVKALGFAMKDTFDAPRSTERKRIVAVYDYTDANGVLLFQKVRYEPKGFALRQPDGNGGHIWSAKGVQDALYRTPNIERAKVDGTVVVALEGEKDANTCEGWGYVATCNRDGAAKDGQRPKWKAHHTAQLVGVRELVLVPDNDDAGRAHVRAILKSLAANANSDLLVRVVSLPVGPKGDLTDFRDAGGTREQFAELVDAAPLVSPAQALAAMTNTVEAIEEVGDEQSGPSDLSEDALAAKFTLEYGGRFLCVQGRWYRYTDTHFADDATCRVFDAARAITRSATTQAGCPIGGKDWRKVRSSATIAAIEKIVRSDPVHAATYDVLDPDTMLLNTPNGAYNLHTLERVDNDPAHRCTKITAVAPGGDAPTWRRVLYEWTNGDQQIVDYLQRLAGYALTGSTREHALVFLYGSGGNGKSAFLRALAGCLHLYATTAPIATFTESANEQHPTDLARLRGARLVITTETEANRRWADAKVKQLTGGDRIAARFMRQDFFEFDPQFTLIVAGNHRPRFSGVDESIRRRLHIVPFTVTIAPEHRDTNLDEKLRQEWPGILAWALAGCVEWQRQGLNPPDAVKAATADYLDAEDTVGAWVKECVELDASEWSASSNIFANWQAWAHARGERVGSIKWLSEELQRRGFHKHATRTARGFSGIRLVSVTDVAGTPHIDVPRAPAHDAHAHARLRSNTEHASHPSQPDCVVCADLQSRYQKPDMLCIDCRPRATQAAA